MKDKMETIRLLHFLSQGKDYGIDLSSVREVLRIAEFQVVSELPSFVRGVVNVRGEWMPVIDFSSRAGGALTALTLDCRMLVLRIRSLSVILLVERVVEIFSVETKSVSANLHEDVVLDRKYIRGTLSRGNAVMVIVDIDRLLTSAETTELEKAKLHA